MTTPLKQLGFALCAAILATCGVGCDDDGDTATDATTAADLAADTLNSDGALDTSSPSDVTALLDVETSDASQDSQVPDLSPSDVQDSSDLSDAQDSNVGDLNDAELDVTDVADITDVSDVTDASDADLADSSGLPDGPSSDRFTARPLSTTTAPSGFYEYLPPGYGDGTARPLLVFWHGIGENGDGEADLVKVSNVEPPKLMKNDSWPSERPFIVLSPQHPGGGCPTPDEIHDFIAWGITAYDVDTTRVYLTGLSCGAIGSWNYLRKYTNQQIAAIVPIAGDGKGAWNQAGCDLGLVPIWAFHGDADPTVDVSGTNVPIDNLLAQCPQPPRKEVLKTIYPGVGHNSWTRTYTLSAGHDIYTWMLGFTNP